MTDNLMNKHSTSHHEGLGQDLIAMQQLLQQRRQTLQRLGGLAALALAGCGGGDSAAGSASSSSTTSTAASGTCSVIPTETAGPYPGDGSNTSSGATSNVLSSAGVQRSDIRSSIAGLGSGTASGVVLTVKLNLSTVASGCVGSSATGYAVYLWHCDALGRYSLYSSGITAESYLRGLQVAGSDGSLTFTTIFPGCYAGRWPHIHFEVFSSLANATVGNKAIKTSQLALPQSDCATVYASAGYTGSATNLAGVSLGTDNVFNDGSSLQLATVSGSVAAGYTATLNVAV